MQLVACVLVTESSSEGCKHDLGSHRVHKIQTKRKIAGHMGTRMMSKWVAALTIQTRDPECRSQNLHKKPDIAVCLPGTPVGDTCRKMGLLLTSRVPGLFERSYLKE